TGSELRMLSYGDERLLVEEAQQVLAQTIAARDAAQSAKDIAEGYASDAVSQGNVPIYATRVGVEGIEIPVGINAIRTNGFASAGDGGAALYKKVDSEPSHAGKVKSADGAWWEIVPDGGKINPLQLGARGDG